MKIVLYTTNFLSGGAQKITINLANYYLTLKHEIFVICSNSEGPFLNQIDKRINLIDLKSRPKNSIFSLAKNIKEINPDVIISNMRLSNIILGLSLSIIKHKKIKTIFLEANTFTNFKYSFFYSKLFYWFFVNLTYHNCKHLVANSNDTKKDLQKILFFKKKINIIGNPVIDKYKTTNINFKNSFFTKYKKSKFIISAGSFDKQKNFKTLYKIFKNLRQKIDIKLVILGDGTDRKKIIKLAKSDGLINDIYMPGFVDNPQDFFAISDVFVLTSLWEGFGNVIVEALYNNLPVISFNCPGGPKDILEQNKYGFLIENFNQVSFEEKIDFLLKNKYYFKDLKKRSLDYSIQKIGNKYLSLV